MATKKGSSSRSGPRPQHSEGLAREISGLVLVALGGVAFLALLSVTRGVFSDWVAGLLRRLFGWGGYLVALTLLAAGMLLLWKNLNVNFQMPWQRIIGIEALFVVALSLTHLWAAPVERGFALARAGGGGGYVGWTISYFLGGLIGTLPTAIVLSVLALAAIALTLHISPDAIRGAATDIATSVQRGREQVAAWWRMQIVRAVPQKPSRVPAARPAPEVRPAPTTQSQVVAPEPKREPPPLRIETAASTHRKMPRRRKSLPPIDLLVGETQRRVDEDSLKAKARIIEETLDSLGVPSQVIECRHGPRVTQFGVAPGYVRRGNANGEMRVRVSKIASLANDLALALAATSIRIEAPVPGRAVVGIEIPNEEISLVTLRGVMETSEYLNLKGPLKVALGRDVAGAPVAIDLARMPHLLIAGATGSGKSICVNALICGLLLNHTPETLRLILIDPKRVELSHFNDVPHLLGPVIFDVAKAVTALQWATHEMEQRYQLFAREGARNLAAYNRKALTSNNITPLPYIVICIDEMAELMMIAPEEIERTICRIAQMARATGIHLVISTQRPSVDVVTGLIKANFPARICFAVTSLVDSRVVLDAPGAERLLGRGDMLFMAPDSSKLTRIQGCLVSDEEIGRLVDFWRDKTTTYLSVLGETTPWEEGISEQEDELFPEAVRLVQSHQQASVSFLQRRLRIGYPRAARLMDALERHGIVAPGSSGTSREVYRDALDA